MTSNIDQIAAQRLKRMQEWATPQSEISHTPLSPEEIRIMNGNYYGQKAIGPSYGDREFARQMATPAIPGSEAACRILSGNTASEEQRRIALAMMNDNYRHAPLPDVHHAVDFERTNKAHAKPDRLPLMGVLILLMGVVIGAALAVWGLV